MEQHLFFLGLDWGNRSQALCFRSADATEFVERSFEHAPRQLGQMLEWIDRRIGGRWDRLAVGLERPHGLLVQILLARGAAVYAINPKSLAGFRDRYSVAGAKDDRRDARILCDTMPKDAYAWRRVEPRSDQELILHQQTHSLEALEQDMRRVSNRLWNTLASYHPALIKLTSGADEPWLWDLVLAASTPDAARRLGARTIGTLLKRHRIRKRTVEEVRSALAAPPLQIRTAYVETQSEYAMMQARLLKTMRAEQLRLEHAIEATLEQIRSAELAAAQAEAAVQAEAADSAETAVDLQPIDYDLIKSIPGIGARSLATLYSEAAGALRRRDYQELRSLGGVAPVTKQSGKTRFVTRRQACNGRLRQSLHHAANVSRRHVDHWRKMYLAMRERGLSHPRALRGIADRMLKVLIALLRQRQYFQPEKVAGHAPAVFA